MRVVIPPKYYPRIEEKWNIASHALGLLLSMLALVVLLVRAFMIGNVWHIVSFSIFGISLISMYAASTLFHSAKNMKLRYRLNIFDHSAIYILIAGTYTPFALVTLHGTVGWIIFGIIWGVAILGVVWKFMHVGKYVLVSTLLYVMMGWIMIFAVRPLVSNLPFDGIVWLMLGVLSYMIGAIFFSFNKMKYNHAVFHKFVLLGSFCHFISIFYYVLPGE